MSVATWLAVVAVVDGLVAAALASAWAEERGRPAGAAAVVLAVVLAGGAALALVPFLPGGGFTAIHLAYLVIVVALPVVGGVTLARWARDRRDGGRRVARSGALLAVPLVALAPVGAWATHVQPFRLEVDREALEVAARPDEPIRVGVLADLQTVHITDHERDAVRLLADQEPDLVLLPGDFLQGAEEEFVEEVPALQDLLAGLDAPGGVYLVEGDVDSPERMERIVAGTDLRWLRDEIVTIDVRGTAVHVGGIVNDYERAGAEATMDALATTGTEDDVRLLVAHRPDAAFHLAEQGAGARPGVDLVVAGHTHGGQIAFPLVGPLFVNSGVSRAVGAGGLHQVDGQPVYVGTGVGLERSDVPQVRFGTRPSVGMVELR